MIKNKAYLSYEREQHKRARRREERLFEGTALSTSSGYMFFRRDGSTDDDWMIPAEETKGAMQGDRVQVVYLREGLKGPTCAVRSILRRAYETLTGVVHRGRVIADDKKLRDRIVIEEGGPACMDGDRVVVRITHYPDGWEPPMGVVTEVLGRRGTPEADVMAVIRRFGIREKFPQEVMSAAADLPDQVGTEELAGRLDLRDLKTFTIDGAHSKDFDDAVSIEPLGHGMVRLGVHIADVNAYVAAGGAIDDEARLRGTSVYFADRVIPMLPESLSNGICSLNEGVDRLTLSCIMDVDASGTVVDYTIAESVIRSAHRLVYGDMNLLLAGDTAMRERYADILRDMELLSDLHTVLSARREERGSIDFDVPESEFTFDAAGHAIGLKCADRGVSERIIEDCMLLANETVARHLKTHEIPALYRVHEIPEASKAEELSRFLRTLGYRDGIADISDPRSVQAVLYSAKGTAEEGVVSKLLLRSMQRARYCPEPLGHYGLALSDYCHFTSPIRRYPDLIVHRALKLSFRGEAGKAGLKRLKGDVSALGVESSACERSAMEAERAVDDVKRCEYMAGHLGETFEGVISGIVSGGFFVELENTAEGFVRLESLQGDRWRADAKNYRIKAERSGSFMRLGDRVTVQVMRADTETGEIDLLVNGGYNSREKSGREKGGRGKTTEFFKPHTAHAGKAPSRRGRSAGKGGSRANGSHQKGNKKPGRKPKGKA